MVITLDGAKVVEVCKCGTERVLQSGSTSTEIRVKKTECEHKNTCAACEVGWASAQNHHGSQFCENGSLASGGKYAHCQCDTCSAL